MSKKCLFVFSVLIVAGLLVSCGSTRTVSRVSSDTAVDLSGRWNDTDAQMTAEAMVTDVMKRPWLSDFNKAGKKKPVVIVGAIRNRSDEHIDTDMFTKSIERELINSGKVSFVASDKEREALRKERQDQQTESNPDTIKRLGQETGADFMMQGIITSTTDKIEGKKAVFYKIDLELIAIETNEKVWIGTKQIKKVIEQSKAKF
jgi:penicillin-binding protein activator